MLSALLVMAAIAIVLGAILGFAAIKFRVDENPLVDKIDAVLPQTQCGRSTFYARIGESLLVRTQEGRQDH